MEASFPRTKRISAGDVVSEVFSIYRENAAALLGSALIVLGLVGLVAGLLQSAGGLFPVLLGAVIRVAGYALYTGFVVNLVDDVRDGRRDQGVGDLFSAATPAIVALVGFGILFGLGVTVGLFLLVVPGLILITFWSVGAPAIVVERIGPVDAFGRSWRLVRGDAWSVFGTLLLVLLIVIVIGIVLGIVATPLGNGAIVVASILSGVITAPIFSLAVSVMYFDLGGSEAPAAPADPVSPPPPPPTA